MAGRPKIKYTEEQRKLVFNLSSIGCLWSEISAATDIPFVSLQRHFGNEYAKGHENLKMSVRRSQFKLMQSGNATMCIWLGKQILGQTDKTDITSGGKELSEIRVTIVPPR